MNTWELRSGFTWSLVLHLGLIAIVTTKALFFPGKPLKYIPTLKVDLVALPDALKKDQSRPSALEKEVEKILKREDEKPKAKTAAPTPPRSKDEPMIGLKKPSHVVESKNRRALERMKSLAKIQEMSKDIDEKPQKPVRGNILSKGSSTAEDARESQESNYNDILRDRLLDHFFLPPWLARQKLEAQVRAKIDARGRLQSYEWLKTSGNEQFDGAVKAALDSAQPFPFPPVEIQGDLLTRGIILGFPL